MAIPIKNTQLNSIGDFDTFRNGGKGSGNFGHSGRPGLVGGSGDGGFDFNDKASRKSAEYKLSHPRDLDEAKKKEKEAEKEFSDYVEEHRGEDYDQKIADRLGKELDTAKEWRREFEREDTYKKMEKKSTDPSKSDNSRKGNHPFDNEVMSRDGLNLDATTDTLYFNDDSNRKGEYHYREQEDGEWVDKKGTTEYKWGSIQFGKKGKTNGWNRFSVSGERKYSGKNPRPGEPKYNISSGSGIPQDNANYHYANSNDGVNYIIALNGKKVGEYKNKKANADGKFSVPGELLDKLAELNKKIKPRVAFD